MIPAVFWFDFFSTPALMFLLSMVGAAWVPLLPSRWHGSARFYLSPAFGLASFVFLATLLGWWLPMGRAWPLLALGLAVLMWRGWHGRNGLWHASAVAGFGLVCSVSLLAPLALYGTFNITCSDAFTYLQHSQWLQFHAFSEPVLEHLPSNVQIISYQTQYLRMGASFLLAGWQAILHSTQPYNLYSSVMGAGVAVACLALGWPLTRWLRPLARHWRFVFLSLPAFSLGGLVFGANTGFMPQTIGLALATAALFLFGGTLQWLQTGCSDSTGVRIWQVSVPAALLMAGAIFSYSELTPFLGVTCSASLGWMLLRPGAHRHNLLRYGALLFGMTLLLLNAECLRIVAALRLQAGAVVGSAVDWNLSGYLAHAFGMHGGIWDPGYQWSNLTGTKTILSGTLLVALPLWGLSRFFRDYGRWVANGFFLPCALMLAVLLTALLYFRFGVASPFLTGVGQSWSQFKLSEWAHPFVSFWILLLLLLIRIRLSATGRQFWFLALMMMWSGGFYFAAYAGQKRVQRLSTELNGERNLGHLYQQVRTAIDQICPVNAPVYLDLEQRYAFYREMLVVYLPERALFSEWSTDHYFDHLHGRAERLEFDHCVLEPVALSGTRLQSAVVAGPFRIGLLRKDLPFIQTGTRGGYSRESDQYNWWHWVAHRIDFDWTTRKVSKGSQVQVRFNLVTRSKQTVYLHWQGEDGSSGKLELPHIEPGQLLKIDQRLPIGAQNLRQISLETDAIPSRFSKADARETAFMLLNFQVDTPYL